ncbi:MAG TPA: phosphatase PAP2 family protein [Oscillospiraceae bacterium]|nr:phosphatase PAP2 family protein [Oscillospiraceae bacterium]
MSFIQSFDDTILVFIQENLRNSFCDSFLSFITSLGNKGMIWIIAALIMLFFKKTRKCGIFTLISLALVCLSGEVIIKHIICRDRPFITSCYLTTTELLIKAPHSYSFPSGHTGSSFAASTSIFLYNKKAGIFAFVLAALIAFSRIYLYVHYPSDILGGIILGTIFPLILYAVIAKNKILKSKLI